MTRAAFDVVVPTVGRPSLARLLDALAAGADAIQPGRILLVDDRRAAGTPLLATPLPQTIAARTVVLRGPGRGPAAARNTGWRASAAPWIAFLDDDVVPGPDWVAALVADLADLPPDVAGSQGWLSVPLPSDRRPTDWERNVHGLERARWATADIAYRAGVLRRLGGFDERFPRAYREDADIGLRVTRAGGRIVRGRRRSLHPVRAASPWVSIGLQAGNADDVLMTALHRRGWRAAAGAPPGRFARHVAIAAAAALGVAGVVRRRRALAALGAAGWLAGTAELAWVRVAPGPRTGREVATMVATSAVIPVAAAYHAVRGVARLPRLLGMSGPCARPDAILFDRDGTLVDDVPYNGDPGRVAPMPGARAALDRVRAAGVATAVVSNQSGVARGLVTADEVAAVNERIEELLGPLGPWLVCPHAPEAGCACRKPAPGLVLRAAVALGVRPDRCAVVGDIGADVEAARAVGARGILVPTARTRAEEISAAPEVARDLPAAVELLLGRTVQ